MNVLEHLKKFAEIDEEIIDAIRETEKPNNVEFLKEHRREFKDLTQKILGKWNYALLLAGHATQCPKNGSIGNELWDMNRIFYTFGKLDSSVMVSGYACFTYHTFRRHFGLGGNDQVADFVFMNKLISKTILEKGPVYAEKVALRIGQPTLKLDFSVAGDVDQKSIAKEVEDFLKSIADKNKLLKIVVNGEARNDQLDKKFKEKKRKVAKKQTKKSEKKPAKKAEKNL